MSILSNFSVSNFFVAVLVSVANSKQLFSARSTEKFDRWRKNSTAHTKMQTLLSCVPLNSVKALVNQRIKQSMLIRIYDFLSKTNIKKVRPHFSQFNQSV
jgi:hypothetical protein